MCDAFPMGGELHEVVVDGLRDFDRSDESYGSDDGRYGGQEGIDKDSDGYGDDDYELFDDSKKAVEIAPVIVAIVGLATLQPELVVLAADMYETTLYAGGTETALKVGADLYEGFTSNDEKESHDKFIDALEVGSEFAIEYGLGNVIGGSSLAEETKLAAGVSTDESVEFIFKMIGGN